MANAPANADDLKKDIMMGKKRVMNFAYGPGSKGNDVLIIDRKRKPDVLVREGKKTGSKQGVTKFGFGTFVLETKKMMITAEKVVPGFSKSLKKYVKSCGLTLGIVVLDENGNLLESDLEGVEDEDQAQGNQISEQDQRRLEDLKNRLRELQGPISDMGPSGEKLQQASGMVVKLLGKHEFGKAEITLTALESAVARAKPSPESSDEDGPVQEDPGPDPKILAARAGSLKKTIDTMDQAAKPDLMRMLAAAVGQIKSRDLMAADEALSALETEINRLNTAPPSENVPEQASESEEDAAARKRWEATAKKLSPAVEKAMQEGKGDLDGINRAWGYAQSQAADGAYDSALKAAAQTAKLVQAAAKAEKNARVDDAEDVIDSDKVDYNATMINWAKARSLIQADITKLKMAIENQIKDLDSEGIDDIKKNTGALFDYLAGIDTRLENTLIMLRNADTPREQKFLKSEGQQLTKMYRNTLDTDFFKAVDNNGFTATNVRGTALDALQKVDQALAA